MTRNTIMILASLFSFAAGANGDQRDEEVFGGEDTPVKTQPTAAAESGSNLTDHLITGGLFDLGWSHSQRRDAASGKSPTAARQAIDLFFDNTPSADYRALLRLRATAGNQTVTTDVDRIAIDEAWLRWDAKKSVFFTLGRQHLKWGAARVWNPTDFLEGSTKDPWSNRDRRFGQDLLKIHIPQEKRGFNYYLVTDYSGIRQADDIQGALRGEFPLGGIAELSLTAAAKTDKGLQFGTDLSSALGPLDLYLEIAALDRAKQRILVGNIDLKTSVLPDTVLGSDGYAAQSVVGLTSNIKYSDNDSITLDVEFFDNNLGYDAIENEIYALATGIQKPLYLGRKYGAASALLSKPGSWDDLSFLLITIRNISDKSYQTKFLTTWMVGSGLSLDFSASHCGGQIGELCFYLPDSYSAALMDTRIPADVRQKLALIPRKPELYALELGATAKF